MLLLLLLSEIVFHETACIKQWVFAIKLTAVTLPYFKQKDNVRESVFSFVISTTGKRVFKTGSAFSGIIASYFSLVHYTYYGIEIYLILVHFIKILLSLLLHEYKDFNWVK